MGHSLVSAAGRAVMAGLVAVVCLLPLGLRQRRDASLDEPSTSLADLGDGREWGGESTEPADSESQAAEFIEELPSFRALRERMEEATRIQGEIQRLAMQGTNRQLVTSAAELRGVWDAAHRDFESLKERVGVEVTFELLHLNWGQSSLPWRQWFSSETLHFLDCHEDS